MNKAPSIVSPESLILTHEEQNPGQTTRYVAHLDWVTIIKAQLLYMARREFKTIGLSDLYDDQTDLHENHVLAVGGLRQSGRTTAFIELMKENMEQSLLIYGSDRSAEMGPLRRENAIAAGIQPERVVVFEIDYGNPISYPRAAFTLGEEHIEKLLARGLKYIFVDEVVRSQGTLLTIDVLYTALNHLVNEQGARDSDYAFIVSTL